jgi:sterol 24-C-methyltransferase
MGLREGMKVLDVGCGVGGPAREIVKFSGANVVGLNNNDYQIQRGTQYAAKEGLSKKLTFVKSDFMVSNCSNYSFEVSLTALAANVIR